MNNKKKYILIIGGTGFIGFHLAKACLAKNFNVFSLSISKPKKIRTLPKVKYFLGKVENKKSLKKFDKYNFNYVVNCGGYVDHLNKKKTYNSHYKGCKNLYYYFVKKNLTRFVQIGSSSEYGKSKSPLKEDKIYRPIGIYGRAKFLATNFFIKKNKNNNFPVVILRLFQTFGTNQDSNRFIPFVINESLLNKTFDCSPCTQKRDFLSIDNVVYSIMMALKKDDAVGKILNIGSGRPIMLKKVINKIIKITKKGKPKFGVIKLRSDENKVIYPNIKKAQKILGLKTNLNFDTQLKKTINYYKKNIKSMKVIILAGGLGTRISEYTKSIPKPMIQIRNKPIIFHIMKHYSKYGFKDFYIAAGYKQKIIKNYFKKKFFDWNVKVINTGQNTMTGGRLKRLKKYLKNETFLLTYGDGLSNINLTKLIKFHKKCKGLVTMTAVRPPARFGAIKIKGNKVFYFKEKSKMDEGWINGGFFVIETKFLKYISSDKTFLEREPLEKITKFRKLNAFKHYGYWQCVDTKRDLERIKKFFSKKASMNKNH